MKNIKNKMIDFSFTPWMSLPVNFSAHFIMKPKSTFFSLHNIAYIFDSFNCTVFFTFGINSEKIKFPNFAEAFVYAQRAEINFLLSQNRTLQESCLPFH